MNNYIDKLIEFIALHYAFDSSVYPELSDQNRTNINHFALRHITLHMVKSIATVASACERADHGEKVDLIELAHATRNLLIDTLRLAEISGMSGTDITTSIEEKFKAIIIDETH